VTIVIEPAVEADLPEVVAMERACYSDPWAASSFAGLPDHPAVHFAVARTEARGAVAGYVVAWFVADEGELANLAVAPAVRRRGVGLALLDSVLRAATARDIGTLFLEVRESNAAARKLYASRDFEEVGRRKGYYRSPQEDALILRCTLKR
jgi:[ribosomal protein S18]-alanine N-acetyltransferase